MSIESRAGADQHLLEVTLALKSVGVSYLSALLRVVQAALREVARTEEGTGQQFERRPQPVLVLSSLAFDGGLTLRFTFADALEGKPLNALSDLTFSTFLERFREFVKELPQPSLWGGAATTPSGRPYTSELAKRMDQVFRELRRSPSATLSFKGRTIEIEGDRMDIA